MRELNSNEVDMISGGWVVPVLLAVGGWLVATYGESFADGVIDGYREAEAKDKK